MREPLNNSPEETTGVRARDPTLCKERKGWATRPGYDSSVDQQCFPDLRVGRSIIKTGPIALFSRIAQPRSTLWLAVAGALSFWLADLAIHVAASVDSTPARWDAAFVFLPPGTFLFAYLIARRVAARRGVKRVGVAMLVGVWLASGTFMAITATATARGFTHTSVLDWLGTILLSIIPMVMFYFAAWEGSLFALLVLMFGALLIWGARTSATVYSSHRRSR